MSSLLKQLLQYSQQDYYPMHMPGHKRNIQRLKGFDPYAIDITEIDGFDNLHDAKGVIRELINRVQRRYDSDSSYLLINGSTVGILAGVSACVKKKDRIIMARNCHKAVYNAVILNELNPVYVYPQKDGVYGIAGGISPKNIEQLLITYPDTALVVLTSPTYEGLVSDIEEIVRICHNYHVPVLIDEAHGAHLGLEDGFPRNSIQAGADLVIHSIHKTLPAFTQTALMHVNGTLVSAKTVETYLGIYETSSPSYLLMAGIDQCMFLLENQGPELFRQHLEGLEQFHKQTSQLRHLKVMKAEDYKVDNRSEHGVYAVDPSKILISVKNTNITGSELAAKLLSQYRIQLEMSSLEYALAMTSICDTKEGYERLSRALCEIDSTLTEVEESEKKINYAYRSIECGVQTVISPYEAMQAEVEEIAFSDSKGRIASRHIMVYPPGIPVVAAGEQINQRAIHCIMTAMDAGLEVIGLSGDERGQQQIRVVR